MSHVIKNLLIALAVVVLFFGVYMFVSRGTGTGGGTEVAGVDIEVRTNQIVSDTKRVDSYSLDTEIFSDTRFNSLKDFHVDIPDVRTGRTNPFLPIE